MGRRKARTVGIDFGTSTTLIAEQAGGVIHTVPIGGTTPWMYTLAGRSAGRWVIGEGAERLPPNDVVRSVKTYITDPGTIPARKPDDVDEIVSTILGQVVRRASAGGLDIGDRRVRLGCPAQWVGEQREHLTRLAGSVGLDAHVDEMVDEPIAAGVDWIMEQYDTSSNRVNGRVLIIDIGGGTLDVALLDVTFENAPDITVLSCRGTTDAGDVLDRALADRIRAHMREAAPHRMDVEDDLLSQYLERSARLAKIELSRAHEARIRLDPPYDWCPQVVITRADVDDVLGPQLERTAALVDLTLREAALRAPRTTVAEVANRRMEELRAQVKHVVLAGGMSQVPGIGDAIRGLFLTSQVHVPSITKATTRVVDGLARDDAYASLNLHRPGLDVVLKWSDSTGDHTQVLFPAFTPVFDRGQIAAHSVPKYREKFRPSVSGAVTGRIEISTIGGEPVPFRWDGKDYDHLEVRLTPDWFTFELRMDGQISIPLAGAAQTRVMRVASWPQVRWRGVGSRPARLTLERVEGQNYGKMPFGWRHK